MSAHHTCDATVPVCSCGRAWDYLLNPDDGPPRYTSTAVLVKFDMLYGPHPTARRVTQLTANLPGATNAPDLQSDACKPSGTTQATTSTPSNDETRTERVESASAIARRNESISNATSVVVRGSDMGDHPVFGLAREALITPRESPSSHVPDDRRQGGS